MLTIRREQMQALSDYMRQSFEDRMVRHIARSFPAQFRKLAPPAADDAPVRTLIQQAIEVAARYEITLERDVGRFIDLMMALGPDFETRTETAWAQSILRDKSISSRARMELIHQQLPVRASEALDGSGSRTY